ncbi:MAG TPA: PilC/PilY family type IV pilus protein, partial [Smithellaceae bacterium]|nr:PilC/PilY family type IV pilus protein [Smithellaceae bacterium]
TCNDNRSPAQASGATRCATANDPATLYLRGYAFIAEDADKLEDALRSALSVIRQATYSFTQASVQSSRTEDENYIYEASFMPQDADPFWIGHLKKFQITGTGAVGDMLLDAADVLKSTGASSRNMKTLIGGVLTDFTTSIDKSYFGATDDTIKNSIIAYVRGDQGTGCPTAATCANPEGGYKLGDVFRSSPVTVGTPSLYYRDANEDYTSGVSPGCSTIKAESAFATYRSNHCRASGCSDSADQEKRIIVVGANDGQLHAFKTKDMTEAWSFIPPNLLSKLKNIAHGTHPTSLTHDFFVDGPVTVSEAWLGVGSGKCKNDADWKTLLVFGEGRGTYPNTWSATANCDSDFSPGSLYNSANYPFYCGYYALDITSPLAPTYKWALKGTGTGGAITSTNGPYLGEAWSKMRINRVKYNSGSDVEKWVGFIGGGFNGTACSGTFCGTNCDCRGKGFFLVSLSDGQIHWSFTAGATGENQYMKYSLPGETAIVDYDSDGFTDRAYIGDLGGNIWRFDFCTEATPGCAMSSWTGRRLFSGSGISPVRPVYNRPTFTRDVEGNSWVFWGTGDKNDPSNIPSGTGTYKEKIIGLKDKNSSGAYAVTNLQNISATTATYDNSSTTYNGYYIELPNAGEKVLADTLVFGGVLFFTTYTPAAVDMTEECSQDGTARLYAINFTTGKGALTGDARSVVIGTGIPSAPVVSMRPDGSGKGDLYVTVSGKIVDGGDDDQNTGKVMDVTSVNNMTNIIYWRDKRLQ